jgi:hypothetical protein
VEQGLDLRGKWEGVWCQEGMTSEVKFADNTLTLILGYVPLPASAWSFIDESKGKLRINVKGESPMLGIYQIELDRVLICYCADGKNRPRTLQATGSQFLLILRRVKPRK